jgi:DNA adenine methylase
MPAVADQAKRAEVSRQRAFAGLEPTGELPFTRPFLKWAGGKTQLLPQLERFYPPKGSVKRYIEPFLGSGAVFFHVMAVVQPRYALLWDNNRELIATFRAVQKDLPEVIKLLRKYQRQHSKSFFLAMRESKPRSLAERAARLVYLNKTCFNGLYRVNSSGIFNVPMGSYARPPRILNEAGLKRASEVLAGARIESKGFRKLLDEAQADDFVYLDPPYDPLSSTASFTAYTSTPFGRGEQEDLAKVYKTLDERGCLLMLSNSDTALIRKLYQGFKIEEVSARRFINSRGDGRGHVRELVVLNRNLLAAAGRTG